MVGSKTSYSSQPSDPVQLNVQATATVTTQPNVPTQANVAIKAPPSIKTQPTVPSQQTIPTHHQQQQLHYQHPMAQQQQVQSYNAQSSLSQPRQPISIYQMSQQAMRPQHYMIGQHYLTQPVKVHSFSSIQTNNI